MNWLHFEGGWSRFKADIQRYWPRLTDAQLEAVAGDRERLVGALRTSYGMDSLQAEEQLGNWQASRQRELEPIDRRATPR